MNKSILVLGAGLVSKPLISYLLNTKSIYVTVASKDFLHREYIDSNDFGKTIDLDISDDMHLETLVKNHDLTVSLLPYAFHVKVAKLCIKHKKHMITASYISDDMKALDEEAKKAGITLLNEIGLDPGIDHMSAMQIIDRVKAKKGEIESFYSNCGGLPYWDATTTPFQYKFSWSPSGVLQAAKNNAEYLKDGKIVKIPNKDLFKDAYFLDLGQFGKYEVYPNRDSVKYIELYNLKGIKTIYRGTIRNLGWSEFFDTIIALDLLNNTQSYNLEGKTYKWLFSKHLELNENGDLEQQLADKLGLHKSSQIINKYKFLGLTSDKIIKSNGNTLFDIILKLVSEKLSYKSDEKDMILLEHVFIVNYADHKEEIKSLLIAHGESGENHIMSKTVGLPLAIASRLMLEGKIKTKGVCLPILKEIYEPVLKELESFDIAFIEETRKL